VQARLAAAHAPFGCECRSSSIPAIARQMQAEYSDSIGAANGGAVSEGGGVQCP